MLPWQRRGEERRVSPCVFVSLQGTLMFSLSSTDADVRVFILSSPGRLVAGGCLGGATKDHHVSPATSSIQQRPSASQSGLSS